MDSMSNNETTALARFGNFKEDPRLREEDPADQKPWLDQLRLAQATSKIIKKKDDEGVPLASLGDFYADDTSFGGTIKVVMGPSRPFGIWQEKANGWKPKLKSHDVDSSDYQEIRRAERAREEGAKTGPDFLIYLIDAEQFVTYHLTGLARKEKKKAYAARDEARGAKIVTLGTKMVGKNDTFVPTFAVTDEPAPAIDEAQFEHAMNLFTAYKQQTGADAAGAGDRPR